MKSYIQAQQMAERNHGQYRIHALVVLIIRLRYLVYQQVHMILAIILLLPIITFKLHDLLLDQ